MQARSLCKMARLCCKVFLFPSQITARRHPWVTFLVTETHIKHFARIVRRVPHFLYP